MKHLNLWTSANEDRLHLSFEASFDCEAELEQEVGPFFQVLEDCAGDWMPDVIKGGRERKYSRAANWKALDEARDENSASVGLYRTQWPALDMTFRLTFPPLSPELSLSLYVQSLSLFQEEERCNRFVEMVRAWALRYPVTGASAHSMSDQELAEFPNFGRDGSLSQEDRTDNVHHVYWLNIFGPKWVETVGRNRMLSTPCHRIEELPNGSVLLVTWPTAADFASEAARQAQARALVHLRPDLDLDTVLRALRERSTTLASVEPRFHPDVAPLLNHEVERVAISWRQRKIAELNAYRPPEPEEWLPASAALVSDVRGEDATLQRYVELAGRLYDFLFGAVKSISDATPGSLTELDIYFLSNNFLAHALPEVLEHMVPSIGAHLGQVLAKNLGGHWIPRKKLEESQVRVGNRVWLPFVRARHYLRSQQTVIDYSLTQLYRVAERHR